MTLDTDRALLKTEDMFPPLVVAKTLPLRPGDVAVTNHPSFGGSHLPDVTVVTPVCHETDGRVLFFAASRAHHAEIGGIVPGSMPPFSKNLAEEGVLFCSMSEAIQDPLERLPPAVGETAELSVMVRPLSLVRSLIAGENDSMSVACRVSTISVARRILRRSFSMTSASSHCWFSMFCAHSK